MLHIQTFATKTLTLKVFDLVSVYNIGAILIFNGNILVNQLAMLALQEELFPSLENPF